VSGGYGQATGAGFNSLQPVGSPAPPPPPPPPVGRNEPYFDTLTPRNVTALVGKSAYLSCRVRNLGNKTVSNFNQNADKCNYINRSRYGQYCGLASL